jgi:hypothetical protein
MTGQEYPILSREEQVVEGRYGRPIADVLRDLYVDRKLSQAEMARELGVHRTTVVEWMDRHGIPARYNRSAEAVA